MKRVLRFKLRFVDTWRPQIESISNFLHQSRVNSSSIGRDEKERWQAAYRLDVTEIKSVLRAAKAMLRYTVKKREDLRIAIEYLEGRITGNEAIAAFNGEVRIGRRRGKIRDATLPFTRKEGLRLSKLENARKARAAYAVDVSEEVKRLIKNDHGRHRLSHVKLSKKYGYSVSVIRRVLGAR